MNRLQKALGISALVLMLSGCEKGQPVRPVDFLFRTGVVQNETYRPGAVSRNLSGSSFILPVYTVSIRIDGREEVYTVRGFDVAEAADTLINPSDSVRIYEMPKSFPNVKTIGGLLRTEDNFRTAMKEIGAIAVGDDQRSYLAKVPKLQNRSQ